MISDKKNLAVCTSLLLLGATQLAPAFAQGPAVESVNGKISVEGGRYGGTDGSVLGGSISFPLGHSYGLQLDGATGRYLSSNYKGLGVHAFWRDPSVGLFGLTGIDAKLGNQTQRRVGLEGDAYLGDFSVLTRLGYQNGTVENGRYASLQVRWYPNENLSLSLGNEEAPGRNRTKIGIEWQPNLSSLPGLAPFAEHESAKDNRKRTVIGLRYYFGGNKTLLKRHRTDDPETLLPDGPGDLIKALRNSTSVPSAYGSGGSPMESFGPG